MKYQSIIVFAAIGLAMFSLPSCETTTSKANKLGKTAISIVTLPDQSKLLGKEELAVLDQASDGVVIAVNDSTYQTMDGFGYTLTGGSAMHIKQMDAEDRHALLKELFGNGPDDIGVSYLRISVGSSDLDEKPFSYNDIPEGETDIEQQHFSLAPDEKFLIPVLLEILEVNPKIKIMGSPWSPPKWMKDNKDTRGGSLMPEYYESYARYLVKYVQGMQGHGIEIDAITVQNEPLHPGNNPSLLMPARAQAAFVKNHLGPAFKKANLHTKIIIYDHNADRPDYPIGILNDQEAAQYIDGSAFHLYGGEIEALSEVHEAHPDKNLYFTEQWIGAPGDFPKNLNWHTRQLIIGASRNWSKTVLEWNLAADPNQDPHTDRGGCDRCLGAITIDGNRVTRNPAYYIIAHASKFVRPGSVRIGTNLPENLPNVAFRTPEGEIVIIVLNDSKADQSFTLAHDTKAVPAFLKPGAVGTYVCRF